MGNAWCCARGPPNEDGDGRISEKGDEESVDLSLDLSRVSNSSKPVRSIDDESDTIMFSPRTVYRIQELTTKEDRLSVLLDQGANMYNQGDYMKALENFKQVLHESKELVAQCHQVQRLQERAPMQRAINVFKGKAEYNIAHTYFRMGKRGDALSAYRDCQRTAHSSGDWHIEVFCHSKIAQLTEDKSLRVSSLLAVRTILKEKNAPPADVQQVDDKLRSLGVDPTKPPPALSAAGPTSGTLRRPMPFSLDESAVTPRVPKTAPDTNGHALPPAAAGAADAAVTQATVASPLKQAPADDPVEASA